jgi:X-Pro dipeptidyl-peptidase
MSRRRLVSLVAALAVLVPGLACVVSAQAAPTIDGSTTSVYIVPTRDAKLYLEVVHPTSHGKVVKAPAILTYSPYSVLGRNGDAGHWTSRGFARMYADVIGTGNSGGCYDYGGNREKRTAYDLIEWIAKQPWSSGKVGMLGTSYDGTTQFAAAVMHPPHLAAIVPQAAIVRWWDYAYSGGLRYTDTNEEFGQQGPGAVTDEGIDTPLGFDFGFAVPPPADPDDPDWAERVASTIVLCDELKHTAAAYSNLPNDNAFWVERDYLRQMGSVKIPALVAANWGDWNVKQVNSWWAYHALTHSTAARLYMGTRYEGHGTPAGGDYKTTVDDWMDRWLRGVKNGIEKRMPKVVSATADSVKTLGYTPVRESSVKPLRLSLGAGTGGAGTLSSKAAAGTSALPWTGTATESEALAHLDSPGHHVTFFSDVLKRDVRVFGAPKLTVRLTSACDYATVAASLVDVTNGPETGGGAMVASDPAQLVAVTRAWMDSRYRSEGYTPAATSTANKPFSLAVAMKPTDYTFRHGHRIA